MSTEPTFELRELLDSVASQLENSFRQGLIAHRGELGSAREEVLRDFLTKHLPKRFEISTGFVFDAHGAVSKQIDIIIADTFECPRFEVAGGKLFYPCESVVAVGELKTSVTSKAELISALNVIRSAKALDRSGSGKTLEAHSDRPVDQTKNHLDQIYGFVFVIDRCMKPHTAGDIMHDYIVEIDRWEWTNEIFHFDNFLLTYQCEDGICPNAMHALNIASLSNNQDRDLFMRFYQHLARAVQVTSIGRFTYWEHLHGEEPIEHDAKRIEPLEPEKVMQELVQGKL